MISRRNFFSIVTMMAVLLFMFLFSQIVRESGGNYTVNTYISQEELTGEDRWSPSPAGSARRTALFFGAEDSAVKNTAELWCEYTKRTLTAERTLKGYVPAQDGSLPDVVLVDSHTADVAAGMRALESFAGRGVTVIFCNLPEVSEVRKNSRLQDMLGIAEIRADRVETEGIHLFSDFLLGGESVYVAEDEEDEKRQDLELTMPWYVTAGGTKVYMVGTLDELLEDMEERNEYFPVLIWRNSYEQARIFAVNGDYMEGIAGVGILDAMMYEAESYFLYPVVNAQNVSVADFPGFAEENGGRMEELYSRSAQSVLRDICWPAISGMAANNGYKLTCFMAAQHDYGDGAEPSGKTFPFYLQQLREFDSEAGLSLRCTGDVKPAEKLERDGAFYGGLKEQYAYAAVYADRGTLSSLGGLPAEGLLENVRTVTCGYEDGEPVISYYNDSVTLQSATAKAETHTYGDNLRVKAIETALAYSNVELDMYPVLWPETEDDRWEKISERMTSILDTYWKPFDVFEQTTLSESDERVRRFLNLDYADGREEDTILLSLFGAEEGWFLLRLHGEEIDRASGAEYREIETGTWLVHAVSAQVRIELKRSRGVLQIADAWYGEDALSARE